MTGRFKGTFYRQWFAAELLEVGYIRSSIDYRWIDKITSVYDFGKNAGAVNQLSAMEDIVWLVEFFVDKITWRPGKSIASIFSTR